MKDRTGLIIIATGCLLLLSDVRTTFGKQSATSPGCSVITESLHSIFISFEDTERAGSFLLKFNNNTTCPVIIETDDIDPRKHPNLFKRRVSKTSDGNTKTEHFLDWPIRAFAVPVFYDFEDVEAHKAPRPANYGEDRHLVFYLSIPPGQSVVFPVIRAHLAKGFRISLPFRYTWEPGPRLERVSHRVYFNSADLPAALRIG